MVWIQSNLYARPKMINWNLLPAQWAKNYRLSCLRFKAKSIDIKKLPKN